MKRKNPCSDAPISSIKPSQESGGWYRSEGWANSILMPIILDTRCPHTFGHVV
uniref:Uncharacterized protein n=1 Tax=Anguilla anguilla TaxID=7936 RepID=A0A0E9QKY0_ANGAN